MGLSFRGIAMLGISFEMPSRLTAETVIPSCEHSERIGHAFCSVCGTRVSDRKVMNDEERWEAERVISMSLEKDYVFHVQRGAGPRYYLGYGLTSSQHSSVYSRPMPELSKVRETILEILAKAWIQEVYDETTFGLHSIFSSKL